MASGRLQHKKSGRFSPVISSGLMTIKRESRGRCEPSANQEAPLTIAAPPPRYQTRYYDHHEHRHHPYKIEGGGEDGLTTPRRPEANAIALAEVCGGLSPREKQQLGLSRRTDKVMTFLQSARERKIPVRSGKWHPEEDAYLRRLVELFNAGVLDDMPAKVSMRGWLAKMLNCCPMRISKKQSHGEKFEGKVKYSRDATRIDRMTQAEYDATSDHVARLRAEFIKAWAKDELTRRTAQTEDMTFEEWYMKVVVLVPTPRIARNQYIDDAKKRPQPTSVNHFRQELAAEGKRAAFHARSARDMQLARRKLGAAAAKRTLGQTLDALVKSNKAVFSSSSSSSSSSDVSTDSECFMDTLAHKDTIKQEIVDDECTFAPLGDTQLGTEDLYHSSQPFAEDNVTDRQPVANRADVFAGTDPVRYKLPVLRFDLSDSGNGVSTATVTADAAESRTLDIAVSNPACVPVMNDTTAPTGSQRFDGDAALEEIALLATDADLFSLDEIPLDSWLYESLTSPSPH